MLKNNFGMELVELFPKPVEDVTKNLKKKKQKPNNEEGDDDGEDSSDEEDENGRKKKKKAQAGDGSKRRGAAKSFCLRSTLDSSVIARCVDALDVEDNEAELRLDNDLKGALGDLGSIKKDLKEWKRGRDVIFDWQTGPDQVTLFGVLYVILSLILVTGEVS